MLLCSAVCLASAAFGSPGDDLSHSKLSIHLLGGRYTQGARKVVHSGPRILKIFDLGKDMLDAAREYKRRHPKGKVILRVWHTRKWTEKDDPIHASGQFWSEVLHPHLKGLSAADRKLIDYVEGPNEGDSTPTWFSLSQAEWFGRFSARLADHMASFGVRPIVGCIGVGQPGGTSDQEAAKWRAFFPALSAANRAGGGWSYHSYTIDYSTDPEKEQWYSLRYRKLIKVMEKERPDLARMPLFLTEGGVDYSGNAAKDGWQARGTQKQFQDWLVWFDSEMQKDSQVEGITLFQSGDPEIWPSFELEPILPWLAQRLKAQRFR